MEPPSQEPPRRVSGSSIIAAAIVAAALILSWDRSGSTPHYQIAGSGIGVVRLDTDSGELIACDMQRCVRVQEPDRAKTAEALGLKQQPAGNDSAPQIPKQR